MSELNDLVSERNKLNLELHVLRLKESQEQRFIWWVREVFAKNVQDTVAGIIEACTYQDEPTAAAGIYGLPIKCFEMMRRLTESTHGIYDGTYLDVKVSTDAKDTNPDYPNPDYYNHAKTSSDNNKPSDIEISMTEDVLINSKTSLSVESDELRNTGSK